MFWLIEDLNQLKGFYNKGFKQVYIEVIPTSHSKHPVENEVSLIYVRPINYKKGYIISINHTEALSINLKHIEKIISQFDKVFVYDKKLFMHYFYNKNIIDLMLTKHKLNVKLTSCHEFIINGNQQEENINIIIPINKHYEFLENKFNQLKQYINAEYNSFFNNKASLVFNHIEENGIRIDIPKFEEHFKPTTKDILYTEYNYNTLTTRPSNRFGGINFAAISKKDNRREAFIPKNDYFLEMDISAYHPTLISNLIKYKFPEGDIHEYFAELYGVSYDKAKELTFKQINGGVFDNYKHLEFFQKTTEYIEGLWEEFNENGFVEVPVSKYKLYKDELEDMNPQKLMNYYIQALETAVNVIILWDIIKLLKDYKTHIVLYVYDSILLDMSNEEEHLIEKIKNEFEKRNLKIKMKKGNNYGELRRYE